MKQLVFSSVPIAGFSTFRAELSRGAWQNVDTSGYDGPNRTPLQGLGRAPLFAVIKVRISWMLEQLEQAIEGASHAKDKDFQWDGCQKHLVATLGAAATSNDPDKREAAKRLQAMLLLGAGESQTKLRYQEEVDFGRKQVADAQSKGTADITLLNLSEVMTNIANATEALALAIGHGESAESPYRRKKMALAECAATLTWATQLLEWIAESGSPGAAREEALALRAPFEELAARYPIRTNAVKPAPQPSPTPSPTPTP